MSTREELQEEYRKRLYKPLSHVSSFDSGKTDVHRLADVVAECFSEVVARRCQVSTEKSPSDEWLLKMAASRRKHFSENALSVLDELHRLRTIVAAISATPPIKETP